LLNNYSFRLIFIFFLISVRSEENVIALAAPPVSPTTVINDYVCPKGNDYCFTSCCSDDINAKQSACPPDNYKALGFCDKCCTPSAAPTAAPVATVTAKPSFKPSGVPTTSGPTAGPSYAANDIQLSGTNQGIITPTVTGGGSMKIENNGAAVTATQTGTGRIVITNNGAAVTATNTGTGIMTIISDCIGAVTVTRTGNGATNVVATGVAAITYTLTGDGDATYPNQL
jgi:hypothetical protein